MAKANGGAPAAAGSLPWDAIFDILSWAPVKSVCRFRCVSKDWLALISDPAFIAQHKSRSEPLLVGSYRFHDHGGLLVMDMEGNVLRTINGLGSFPGVTSSLDNLVCVHGREGAGTRFRLVDITTGKVLLTCPTSDWRKKLCTVSLGRAAASNSSKVVRITETSWYNRQYAEQYYQTCEVLTLGHDGSEWRKAPSPPAFVRMSNHASSTAAVNGVVHFLSKYADDNGVFCFDLESEEWGKKIEGPLKDIELGKRRELIRITQLKDTLCMIQTEKREIDHLCTNIWLLIDRCGQ